MAEYIKGLVSLGIPVFNKADITAQGLESLFANTKEIKNLEVIVVDNGSTDNTQSLLSTYSQVLNIKNDKNLGVAPAWNQIVEHARGEWIGILNNDLLFTNGWLSALLKTAERHHVKVIYPSFTSHAKPPGFPNNKNLTNRFTPNVSLTGWCFLVHRSVFEKIGTFDEQFEMGWFEERDFEMRLRKAKIKYGMDYSSYVHHLESKTIVTVPGINKYMAENRKRFLKKHPRYDIKI